MKNPHWKGALFAVTWALFANVVPAGSGVSKSDRSTETSASSDPLPADSLYHLPIVLTTARGDSLPLSSLRGKALIVTMFYSRCTSVCPLLTMQVQNIIQRLSSAEQRRIHILMVSFDSSRDTPEALTAFAANHHISEDYWIIARASASDIRLLAAALGIQYRELADHTFNHSTVISLADREGVVRAKTSDLTDERGDFLATIHRQLASRR